MTTIGFIGIGNMGKAIIKGLHTREDLRILGHTRSQKSFQALSAINIEAVNTALELARRSDFIILAVKPHQIEAVISEIAKELTTEKCILSIAAGISLNRLRQWVGSKSSVVRVMPNTPAMVGAGVFALCMENSGLTPENTALVKSIFQHLGQVHVLPESKFDAFTALAGSGPAYVFYFMEALIEAGVTLGLSRPQATDMTKALFTGSSKLAAESDMHISLLREMVCSPAGTTIAATNTFDAHALRSSILQGVLASAKRSSEL